MSANEVITRKKYILSFEINGVITQTNERLWVEILKGDIYSLPITYIISDIVMRTSGRKHFTSFELTLSSYKNRYGTGV